LCVLQALPDSPESLCLSEMGGTESRDGEVGVQGQLYLNIGLHNGVLLRTVVDQVTGDLSDTRTRQGYSCSLLLGRIVGPFCRIKEKKILTHLG